MIAIIRITGDVNLKKEIRETLERLRLRKKYTCVVLKDSKINSGMIKRVNDFVAYGEIKKEVFETLIEKRGKLIDKTKKLDAKKIVEGLEKGDKYTEVNLKPFFGLHPPRKGIDSKKHFGIKKGVLGNNKEKINDLILRML